MTSNNPNSNNSTSDTPSNTNTPSNPSTNAPSDSNDSSSSHDSPGSNNCPSRTDSPSSPDTHPVSGTPNNQLSFNTSPGPNLGLNDNDIRCRRCNHHRVKCPICRPQRVHHSAANKYKSKPIIKSRGKAYCCKCSSKNRINRYFDPRRKEKLVLIKYVIFGGVAATQLRSYIVDALKSKQCYSPPQLCGQLPPTGSTDDQTDSMARTSPLVVMNCRIFNNSNSSLDLSNLDHTVREAYYNVGQLTLLIQDGQPIDSGVLSTVLNILFNQLAVLNHHVFPTFTPAILSNRKIIHHSLRIARGRVQTAYKDLWVAARRAGVLRTPHMVGPHGLATRYNRTTINPSRDSRIQDLLWRARVLFDELRFWLGLLNAGMSL